MEESKKYKIFIIIISLISLLPLYLIVWTKIETYGIKESNPGVGMWYVFIFLLWALSTIYNLIFFILNLFVKNNYKIKALIPLIINLSTIAIGEFNFENLFMTENKAKIILNEFYSNNNPEEIIGQPLVNGGWPRQRIAGVRSTGENLHNHDDRLIQRRFFPTRSAGIQRRFNVQTIEGAHLSRRFAILFDLKPAQNLRA